MSHFHIQYLLNIVVLNIPAKEKAPRKKVITAPIFNFARKKRAGGFVQDSFLNPMCATKEN